MINKKLIILIILVSILVTLLGCNLKFFLIDNEIEQSKPKSKIVLTVLAGQSTSDAGIEDMIDEMLKKKCPDIELEWECVDWGEKFASQITARFASGDTPDIMIGKAQDVATYARSGNLSELNGAYLSYINSNSLPAVSINNKVYGLPYNAVYQGVLYNKSIFKKYGLTVPTTQKELKEVVQKLKKENITPFASHFQEIWNIGNMTMQFAMNDVFNKYPNWGDKFRGNKVSFKSSKEFQQCFKYNKDILDASWEDAMNL